MAMDDSVMPDYRSNLSKNALVAANIVLLTILAWLLIAIVAAATSRGLQFDGAMNLGISRSIAEGYGPREIYDSADLFPPGIQSKEPYVLLGALVFKMFGVGHFQAQLPNLVYLSLLGLLLFIVFQRITNTTTALCVGVLLLAMPSLNQYGLNGYGEVPTLFFGLAALAVIAWPSPHQSHWRGRCLLAGVLAGLSLATKVVGVAEVAVVGFVLCFRLYAEKRHSLRDFSFDIAIFVGGVAAPLLLVEWWRWYWLGTESFLGWWKFQFSQILHQSGVSPKASNVSIYGKISSHFKILANESGLGPTAAGALLSLPFLATAFAYFSAFTDAARTRSKWFLFGLSLLAGLYIPWWLAIVSDEKAWLRYIYIGLISLTVLSAVGLVGNLRGTLNGHSRVIRLIHAALALGLIAIHAPLVNRALQKPMAFKAGDDVSFELEASRLIDRLPPDAIILGYGWYTAPTVQLYSDRAFMDLTDWPIGYLAGKPTYLVADYSTLVTGMLDRALVRYPNRALMQPNPYAQVFKVDFSNPTNPFTKAHQAQTLAWVEFDKIAYAPTSGMEPYDPIGGRFIESDSEVLLRYDGQAEFELSAYMDAAIPSHYRWPGSLNGRVIVGDCPPLPFKFDTPGWRQFKMPLACKPARGNVRVRILLDNAFDWPLLKDRQRAMLLRAIGFVDLNQS